MYYRRKIILALLEQFGEVNKTKMQKLLFLLSQFQQNKSFDFVPYKFGCYSFQANNDLRILTNQKLVLHKIDKESNSTNWKISSSVSHFDMLKKADKESLLRLKNRFSNYSQDELIKYTYVNYPYFAINSKIINRILNDEEIQKVKEEVSHFKDKTLFTIGYEGISLEKYINTLIINDVKILCDVRKNSFSMKYGFSKKQLENACESVNIKFLHIPQLGIISEKRKDLKTLKDYRKLFDEYEDTVLTDNGESLARIKELFKENNRIALTCFEKEVCMCHRGKVAEALEKLPQWNIPIKHLSF